MTLSALKKGGAEYYVRKMRLKPAPSRSGAGCFCQKDATGGCQMTPLDERVTDAPLATRLPVLGGRGNLAIRGTYGLFRQKRCARMACVDVSAKSDSGAGQSGR